MPPVLKKKTTCGDLKKNIKHKWKEKAKQEIEERVDKRKETETMSKSRKL